MTVWIVSECASCGGKMRAFATATLADEHMRRDPRYCLDLTELEVEEPETDDRRPADG